MSKQYSYSQVSKYSTCPKSYKWYYVEKLRETTFTAFLPFGSAVDKALNAVLSDLKDNKTVSVDYKAVFTEAWMYPYFHKQRTYLPDNTTVGYASADMSLDILYQEDLFFINAKREELLPEEAELSLSDLADKLVVSKKQKAFKHFSDSQHKMLNILYWCSMKRKGHLMLDAYVRDIVPQIDEVVAFQEKINLTKSNGDTVVGYVDAILRLKGHDGVIVCDNKTSARPYDQEDVHQSPQLGQYCYTLDIDKAAYLVMLKSIVLNKAKTCVICHEVTSSTHKTCAGLNSAGKRCNGAFNEVCTPVAKTQLFVDVITKQSQDFIIDQVDEVTQAIEAHVFPANISKCDDYFGGVCVYKNLCWSKDASGLVKVE